MKISVCNVEMTFKPASWREISILLLKNIYYLDALSVLPLSEITDSQHQTSCEFSPAKHFFSCIQKAISFCHSFHPLLQTLETSSNAAPPLTPCLICFPLTSYHIVSSFSIPGTPTSSFFLLGFVMELSW